MVSPLAQANRVAVMVAMGTLLNVQVQAQHVRLAGDALVLKYSVLLVSALFIALILPSALAELKPILATLVCMPIASVYIQNAIDNGVNSTAASLAVHTSNIISFALLLILVFRLWRRRSICIWSSCSTTPVQPECAAACLFLCFWSLPKRSDARWFCLLGLCY